MTRGAQEPHGAPGHVDKDDGQEPLDELVGELQAVAVAEDLVHMGEVMKAALVDRGHARGPALGEDELKVREGRPLLAGDGHVEGGVAAEGEGEVDVVGVGHGKGLGEASARERVGHVQAKVEGVGSAGLVGGGELVGDARGRPVDDGMLVEACDSVALERDVAPGRDGMVAAQAPDDGEEHRSTAGPEPLVALPEVLAAVERETHELGSLGVDGG